MISKEWKGKKRRRDHRKVLAKEQKEIRIKGKRDHLHSRGERSKTKKEIKKGIETGGLEPP